MKRFFFRSSASSDSKNNALPPALTDKQAYREDERAQYSSQSFESSYFNDKNPTFGNDCLEANLGLRRCHSFSSGSFLASGIGHELCDLGDPSDSPSSSGDSCKNQNYNHTRYHVRTPEKHTKAKRLEAVTFENHHHSGYTRTLCDSSTTSSSNDSNKVLDLYIDGEQQHESTMQKDTTSHKGRSVKGRGNRPPRVQYTAPSSPTGGIREKPIRGSSKFSKGVQQYFSPMNFVETGVEHDLSEDLAKHVVERLSQSQLKNQDPDVPISLEDVYAGSVDRRFGLRSTEMDQKVCCPNEADNAHMLKDYCGFVENDGSSNALTEDDVDTKLRSKLKEVEQKIYSFSSELEQESFLGHVPDALVHIIRSLIEEKTSLAIEVSSALRNHMDERSSIKQEVRMERQELNAQFRRLEREKNELQSALEKELDRRSSDWSSKLEKFQEEEQRLRHRAKELAEQNVSLQREVSSLSEKEKERSKMMVHSDQQIKELHAALEATTNENQELRRHICELQENFKVTKEERDCLRRNFEDKEDECKDLHRSVTRQLRTCSEQEKTIDGLQGVLSESIEKKKPLDSLEKHVHKLQIEQLRLVGVEQALRREVDSYKHEVDSLRHENINLLNRLKCCGKEGGSLTFKMDQELSARLCCLQTQGLSLLAQSNNLCSQLLEYGKGRTVLSVETKEEVQAKVRNLDGQFIVDCDIKIQGLRRGSESMSRSLQTVSSVLHEKSILVSSESQTLNQEPQDMTTFKLRAEMLLTSLLQEKLYAKELQVEQLQAELATAVRGNDVIRCELQNAVDTLSSTTHKMKTHELQMLKCVEKINQLESDLEECSKELAVAKGILPKVTEERDMMWKEVKQYSENNMLLNSEVISLKKRIEGLEEDLLLKEGQITILKDSLGKPFDLLSSSAHTEEFELQ
ncbi:hypothetical protein V2J09_001344 [Rumex salicifolius]